MTEEERLKKNKQIAEKGKETRARHGSQRAITICCKFRNEKRNKEALEHFRKAFV